MSLTFNPLVFSGLTSSSSTGAGGAATWQSAVANQAALPASGNTNGDVRVTLDNHEIWVWTGSAWQRDTDNTITLSGDVTGSGVSGITTTVAFVGTSSAANVHSAELLANAATSANTASTIVKRDGSGNFAAGTITASLTGHASLDVLSSLVGAVNGVASLDSGGHIPLSQLPSSLVEYKGTWAASTNTPTLANGTGIAGWFYIASDSGTVNFGAGNIAFNSGDWVLYDGSIWERAVQSNIVQSVNGATGVVTVNAINQITGDATAGPASGSASAAITLATVNGNVGSFGTASSVSSVTVNAKGLVTAASNTSIQIVESQVTNLVSDLAGKQATGNYITDLTGDVSASGPGSAATTVNSIGGSSAANVHAAELLANAATSANTASAIVKRDGSGNFSSGTITASLTGHASLDLLASNNLSDLASASTARTNLGLGTAAVQNNAFFLQSANNLSDLASAATARTNLGVVAAVTGDINLTSFSAANNQSSAADVAGLAFANGTVRSFKALISVAITATGDLFAQYTLDAIQKDSLWEMSQSFVGDTTGIVFTITTAGQVQYQSSSVSGFVSSKFSFRALVTST